MCYCPITIINKTTGLPQLVSCNKCKDCLNNKSYNYEMLIKSEATFYKYQFFTFLSYDDVNVPIAHLSINEDYVNNKPIFHYSLVNKSSRLEDYYQNKYNSNIISEFYENSEKKIQAIQNALAITRHTQKFQTSTPGVYQVPVLSRYDLQCFVKRLRYYIFAHFSKFTSDIPEIRYYCVGEYGPSSLRPHYHVILFTNCEALAELLTEFVRKAWKFGFANTQLSKGQCADYVSSYSTSTCLVPPYLQDRKIRPFCLHSVEFGKIKTCTIEQCRKTLQYEEITKCKYRSGDRLVDYYPATQVQNHFFPKCYRYGTLTSRMRLDCYTLFPTLQHIYGKIDYDTDLPLTTNDYIYKLVNYEYDTPTKYLSVVKYLLSLATSADNNIVTTISSMIGVSQRFMKNCKELSLTPKQYLRDIERYYEDKEKVKFRDWLKSREECDCSNHDTIFDYDNLVYEEDNTFHVHPSCRNSFRFLLTSSELSYKNLIYRYTHRNTYSSDIINKHAKSVITFNSRIKHKVINDRLGRLLNLN